MVKIISSIVAAASALVLSFIVRSTQAFELSYGQFVLNAGDVDPLKYGSKVGNCTSGWYPAVSGLSVGQTSCSYFPDLDLSVCQCHTANVTVDQVNMFLSDIAAHFVSMTIITGLEGQVIQLGQRLTVCQIQFGWLNGFYLGDTFYSSAAIVNGQHNDSNNMPFCKPIVCQNVTQGLTWRNLQYQTPMTC